MIPQLKVFIVLRSGWPPRYEVAKKRGRINKDKAIKNLILVPNRDNVTDQLTEKPNDINKKEIAENDNRPGWENQDIMEENEQASQEEKEVREEDKDQRVVLSTNGLSTDNNKR